MSWFTGTKRQEKSDQRKREIEEVSGEIKKLTKAIIDEMNSHKMLLPSPVKKPKK